MSKMHIEKLSKAGAKAYAKSSGFENTGEVYVIYNPDTFKLIDSLYEPLKPLSKAKQPKDKK